MSDELEKRLRELVDLDGPGRLTLSNERVLDLLLSAARIGAEIERDACVEVAFAEMESLRPVNGSASRVAHDLGVAIRARGDK
jgi:hypothetical protein